MEIIVKYNGYSIIGKIEPTGRLCAFYSQDEYFLKHFSDGILRTGMVHMTPPTNDQNGLFTVISDICDGFGELGAWVEMQDISKMQQLCQHLNENLPGQKFLVVAPSKKNINKFYDFQVSYLEKLGDFKIDTTEVLTEYSVYEVEPEFTPDRVHIVNFSFKELFRKIS